jgi:hypothetical protein
MELGTGLSALQQDIVIDREVASVETEENGDSKSTNERVLPWLVPWARRAGTRDCCHSLAAPFGPVQDIFSSP